jgi:hypothetical protein
MVRIRDGIIIGGAAGAIGGLTVWIVQYAHAKFLEQCKKNVSMDSLRKIRLMNQENSSDLLGLSQVGIT